MTVAAFQALGAKPTPMALSEVFTSLQQGTIEAQENPLAMIETQSFYEVCPYLILTAHLRAWVYIAMGLAQYERLSDSQKAVVDQAGAECQAYEHELFLDNEEKYYNQLQEQGMEFIEVDTDDVAAMHLRFQVDSPSGKVVFRAENVRKTFTDTTRKIDRNGVETTVEYTTHFKRMTAA